MWSSDLEERIREVLAKDMERASESLAGLEDRVIRAIAERAAHPSLWQRMRERWLAAFSTPRWAFAGGAVLALVLGITLGRLLAPGPVPMSAFAQAGTLFAVVDPQAQSVAVVGDFSAWEPIPLSDPDGDGIWTAVLDLPPGRYEYAFVVDGNWVGQDPQADEYVRSFGEYTSVRYVGTGGGA
ncbi:hypothetical protein DRJ54_00810 [Candidatus Acetothermia bacterium]|jgi:hypothetical protein|nr:MAG: hypothetical protein DRJ54_00810 [Candidatus Acetothermia bacterium]